MRAAFRRGGFDNRDFKQGEIYLVGDEEIHFPDEKFTGRTRHDDRPVVVVTNHPSSGDPTYPLVLVAPLSHRVEFKREVDLEVLASAEHVEQDSLIRLGLIQPVCKVDLRGPVARLSSGKVDEMLALVIEMLGVDLQQDQEDTATAGEEDETALEPDQG